MVFVKPFSSENVKKITKLSINVKIVLNFATFLRNVTACKKITAYLKIQVE